MSAFCPLTYAAFTPGCSMNWTLTHPRPSLARGTRCWAHLPCADAKSEPVALAERSLAALRRYTARAGTGGPADLDEQIRALVSLEDELQRRLGSLLVAMRARGAWARLLFNGAGHYAEERLGIGRSTAEDRARLARIRQCDARFDVLHFEQLVNFEGENETDDMLDPSALLVVLDALASETKGIAVDPQAGTFL